MDYTNLLTAPTEKKSIVGVVGATRGYGYTLLCQIRHVKHMQLRVICSRHPDECRTVLKETGYIVEPVVYCKNLEEIQRAPQDAIIILTDYHFIHKCGITSMVECTGNTAVSSDAAITCLNNHINVYMVSKETDSVLGPYLNQLAKKNHVVYTLVNGDQPRNLIDLISWAQLLGLDIVCAGKASEYDLVWNRSNGEITITDGSQRKESLPELAAYWHYKGTKTLAARKKLLASYTGVVSADLCEMNLVSNITGFLPSAPHLNYPIAKTSELADIFCPREDGGILEKTGVVDVFYHLRETEEASFCGGEFIVIRCENKKMWDILAGKGHVVSQNQKYCCIYYPYHFMGLETPASILLGDFLGIGIHAECQHVSILAGIADENLKEGYTLTVSGHHHAIKGLVPALLEKENANDAAPFYLLNGMRLLHDVKKGQLITTRDVDLSHQTAYPLYQKSLSLT